MTKGFYDRDGNLKFTLVKEAGQVVLVLPDGQRRSPMDVKADHGSSVKLWGDHVRDLAIHRPHLCGGADGIALCREFGDVSQMPDRMIAAGNRP